MLDVRNGNEHHRVPWTTRVIVNAKIPDNRDGLFSASIVFNQTEDETRKIDPTGDQRSEACKDRKISLEELEPATAFHHDSIRLFELDQG